MKQISITLVVDAFDSLRTLNARLADLQGLLYDIGQGNRPVIKVVTRQIEVEDDRATNLINGEIQEVEKAIMQINARLAENLISTEEVEA